MSSWGFRMTPTQRQALAARFAAIAHELELVRASRESSQPSAGEPHDGEQAEPAALLPMADFVRRDYAAWRLQRSRRSGDGGDKAA